VYVLAPHDCADLPAADVRAHIEQSGATFSTSVTEACTHLITTQVDVDKQSTKCECTTGLVPSKLLNNRPDKKASGLPGCHVVSLEWLLESTQARKPLPESKYAFNKESKVQVDTAAQKNGNGKNTEKKPKDVKPTKKRGASEEEGSESKKKVKDSQKATTKSLNIPIDEGFDQRDSYYQCKLAR
jgi:poly [ADP-ribose] polymerase